MYVKAAQAGVLGVVYPEEYGGVPIPDSFYKIVMMEELARAGSGGVVAALGSLGIDSFSAIELRNRFERSLGLRLSATLVWNYPSITAMAPHLLEKMGLDGAAAPAEAASAQAALDDDLAEFLAQAGALSDDDLRKLLNDGAAHE